VIKAPPLSSPTFGIIQEELASDPFQLLVAVTLLNKTRATVALPSFRALVARWPTPATLAAADPEALEEHLRSLGLQTRRTRTLLDLARDWLADPPRRDARHRTPGYPFPGAGADVRRGEVLGDGDPRAGALEVAHLRGLGAYAWDSWRIFCRDAARGVARGWNGEGAAAEDGAFEPEWKRVQPMDKELRAFLKWMWLKEGLAWDPDTGEKVPVESMY
jgi:methyl-CpG-binding domain protein 4